MVAFALVARIAVTFGVVGAFLGYSMGFDNGFEASLECYEEEVKNAYIQSDNK